MSAVLPALLHTHNFKRSAQHCSIIPLQDTPKQGRGPQSTAQHKVTGDHHGLADSNQSAQHLKPSGGGSLQAANTMPIVGVVNAYILKMCVLHLVTTYYGLPPVETLQPPKQHPKTLNGTLHAPQTALH